MFKVKHFQSERKNEAPNWTEAEKFMNKIADQHGKDAIKGVTCYPTAAYHNMLVVYWDTGEALPVAAEPVEPPKQTGPSVKPL